MTRQKRRHKKVGRAVRKNATRTDVIETDEVARAPHSFVVYHGTVGRHIQQLTKDFRKIMEPYTASLLHVRSKSCLKDYVQVAGMYHVSHLCTFSKTNISPYLKLGRFPRGPTLTFRILDYCLARDVRSSLRRQITYEKQYSNHALLIMNNFTGEERPKQLMSSMFQNMFPSINVATVKLHSIRRCVLINYEPENDTIELRHYTIKVQPVGGSHGVRKIIRGKVPSLGRLDELSDLLIKEGADGLSESEAEDTTSHVTLPQSMTSRGNVASQNSSIRLVELGPRMKLQLIKIEESLHEGEIIYHKLIQKSEEEKFLISSKRRKRADIKLKRKREQADNVLMKKRRALEHKKKSMEAVGQEYVDDDNKWYQSEVGVQPDNDLF